jgi:hypothetical protein
MNPVIFLELLEHFLSDSSILNFTDSSDCYERWCNVIKALATYLDQLESEYSDLHPKILDAYRYLVEGFERRVEERGSTDWGLHFYCLVSLSCFSTTAQEAVVSACVRILLVEGDVCYQSYQDLFMAAYPVSLFCRRTFFPLKNYFFMLPDYFVYAQVDDLMLESTGLTYFQDCDQEQHQQDCYFCLNN